MTGSVFVRDGAFILSFDYDEDLLEAVRDIPGRKWDAAAREWSAPLTSSVAVKRFARLYDFQLDAEAEDVPDDDSTNRPIIELDRHAFLIKFRYDRDLIARIKDIPGARWNPRHKAWQVDLDGAEEVGNFVIATGAVIDHSADDALAAAADASRRIAASAASDAELSTPFLSGELLPFQRAGVRYVLESDGGVLIADEMGLGKSVQALTILGMKQSFPAVIVCPASLKLNWAREAERWLPNRSVHVIYGSRPWYEPKADILILNYDIAEPWLDHIGTPTAVIFDESHYLKNGTAARTKAAITLSDSLPPEALRLCLSGTPIVNHPAEIITQLRVLHRIDEFDGPREFKKRYGSGDNLMELNRRLRSSCYLRRRKIDVLKELPPKRWSPLYMEPDPAAMIEYRKAERDIVTFLTERARQAALDAGATDAEAARLAWEQSIRAQAAEHLVAVMALKRLATLTKMRASIRWIEDFLDTGSKLVVFAHHRDVIDALADHFTGGRSIRGGDSVERRQSLVDQFQDDPESRIIICSIRAAGIGLTLTAASDVLFVEQDWTPAAMDQASDRCHRIGQRDSVTSWNLLATGTIDEDIAQLIESKRRLVEAATDGASSHLESSVLADLLVRLTGKGLRADQSMTHDESLESENHER